MPEIHPTWIFFIKFNIPTLKYGFIKSIYFHKLNYLSGKKTNTTYIIVNSQLNILEPVLLIFCVTGNFIRNYNNVLMKYGKIGVYVMQLFLATFWTANRDLPYWGVGQIANPTTVSSKPRLLSLRPAYLGPDRFTHSCIQSTRTAVLCCTTSFLKNTYNYKFVGRHLKIFFIITAQIGLKINAS